VCPASENLGDVRVVHQARALPLRLERTTTSSTSVPGLNALESHLPSDLILLLGDIDKPHDRPSPIAHPLVGRARSLATGSPFFPRGGVFCSFLNCCGMFHERTCAESY